MGSFFSFDSGKCVGLNVAADLEEIKAVPDEMRSGIVDR